MTLHLHPPARLPKQAGGGSQSSCSRGVPSVALDRTVAPVVDVYTLLLPSLPRTKAILLGGAFDGQDLLVSVHELHSGVLIRSGYIYIREDGAESTVAGCGLPAFSWLQDATRKHTP